MIKIIDSLIILIAFFFIFLIEGLRAIIFFDFDWFDHSKNNPENLWNYLKNGEK